MLEAVAKTESPSELTSFGRILPSIEDACEKMDYNTRREKENNNQKWSHYQPKTKIRPW